MTKKCPRCLKKSVQKDGKELGRQRYRCTACGYVFRSIRRRGSRAQGESQDKPNSKSIDWFYDYSVRKQTLSEIAKDA